MKRLLALLCLVAATSITANADTFLYGNNATFETPYVYQINKATGAITQTYTNLSSLNGRGVVVVGNTLYYTTANSPSLYSYNLTTMTNNGVVFSVAGASALSTIAYDGTNFYIGDYSGTGKVYKYSTTGTLLSTVTLANCGGNCDGLEYFVSNGTGYLISNRGDAEGPYDVYNLNGTLKTANFINNTGSTTGIAFDGTNFFTSSFSSLNVYDINGLFVKTLTLTGAPSGFSPLIEDLSADYTTVLPPSPPAVPEPGSLLLTGTGILGVFTQLRRRFAA